MEGCPNTQSADGGEIFGRECALERECGCDCGIRPYESDTERIAERLKNAAAVRFHRSAPDCVVPSHSRRHRLAMRVPALGTPFDVGEEKRDRSRRKRRAIARSRRREPGCHAGRFGLPASEPG